MVLGKYPALTSKLYEAPLHYKPPTFKARKILPLEKLADEVIETDVLILGGGLAGCMAAIMAKNNKDVDVTVLDKATVRRGGDAGGGMDHHAIAHPQINGLTAEEYGRMRTADLEGLASTKLSIVTAKDALKPIPILEEIGVKFREEDGAYRFVPGRSPKPNMLFYRGADLKLRLAAEVNKKGVRVFDRTMCINLITKDGAVVGATAVNVRNGKFLVFKAKATLLATGGIFRLYGSNFATFPNNLFYAHQVATNSGDGSAAAYRAGAKLTNMEFTYVHVELAGFSQACLARHAVPIKNSKGEYIEEKYPEVRERYKSHGFYPWTNYCYMPDMLKAEAERDVLYHDTTEAPDEAETYAIFMCANETPMLLKVIRDRGGLKAAPFEVATRDHNAGLFRSFSGVMFDEKGETSLKNLFVAGDAQGGIPSYGAVSALSWGYRIGNYLKDYAPNTGKPTFDKDQLRQVQADWENIRALLGRNEGVDPLELEDYVRKVMLNYVHIHKIEPRLKRALELIAVVKERFVPALATKNPHELMRALEIQNILDMAEVHAYSALLRTETRMSPQHYRVDYPNQDDVHWRKNIVIQNVDGEIQYALETLV